MWVAIIIVLRLRSMKQKTTNDNLAIDLITFLTRGVLRAQAVMMIVSMHPANVL